MLDFEVRDTASRSVDLTVHPAISWIIDLGTKELTVDDGVIRSIKSHGTVDDPAVSISEESNEEGTALVDLIKAQTQDLGCLILDDSPTQIDHAHVHVDVLAACLQLGQDKLVETVSFSVHVSERG